MHGYTLGYSYFFLPFLIEPLGDALWVVGVLCMNGACFAGVEAPEVGAGV